MTEAAITRADLRAMDLFDDLDDAELDPWLEATRIRPVEPGEILAEQGEEAPGVLLILAGSMQALTIVDGREEPVSRHEAPTWAGAIAVLTGGPLGVRMLAEPGCRVALIEPEDFRRLAYSHPSIQRRVMQQVAPVMSRIAALEQNRERLASLGTMAAGLAHELNNPAAAARRAAAEMSEAVEVVTSALGRFVEAGIERAEAHQLLELQQEALARAAGATALDTLDAADAEDELLARLEALGVAEPWRISEPLAAAGVDQAWLDRVAELAGSATDAALHWVAATLTAGRLAVELQESTERMSALVGAVKSYAYMDRGELVEVDLHEGLDTTVAVLAHKLKHTKISIARDYDRTIPKVTVRGSELNQVWTNLIDNAIDALGERGTIAIRTYHDGACAFVDVTDDGPGIPPEIGDRVFDSFFTTKDVGQGTGLGLATARRIVVDRHNGSLTVHSGPGETTFHVSLPLRGAEGGRLSGDSEGHNSRVRRAP
jgi:signal transduction histidine kinase